MSGSPDTNAVAEKLRAEVDQSKSRTKFLKLHTLLGKFGYSKRSDQNTLEITEALSAAGLTINPPIVKLTGEWTGTLDDFIHLSSGPLEPDTLNPPPPTWNADGWFDRIAQRELRTEKEVEIKFIVPLLLRLGYGDDDRFDGMPVKAAQGSKGTTLVIDFALFNSSESSLSNQPLLTVEAKREGLLVKQKEIVSAQNQAKSYCYWTQCDFFMVTDSRTVHAFHVHHKKNGDLAPLFECERKELRTRFGELYGWVSKETLTRYYLAKLAKGEELF